MDPSVWHPFTQLKGFRPKGRVIDATGAWLTLDDGRRVLDGIASWWVNLHGHSHPKIVKAIAEQAAAFDQVILADFTHTPALELHERLVPMLPGDLSHLFFSDDGSTSVEVALKMAWQAQGIRGEKRFRMVALEGGYHGDTLGAMSVGARDVFSRPFEGLLFDTTYLPHDDPEAIEAFFHEHGHEVVCMILEPMMQGAGGMRFTPPDTLRRIAKAVQRSGAYLIADEVATGFGRTGTLWACEQADVVPDLLCMSKGITGGSLALGVTACRPAMYALFLGEDKRDAFLHGHSYTGNPICCAAAIASLSLFEEEQTLAHIAELNAVYRRHLSGFEAIEGVENVRELGAIFAYDLSGGPGGYLDPIGKRLQDRCFERGLYVRPLGHVVYLMPPYCITTAELDEALVILLEETQALMASGEGPHHP